MSVYYIYPNTEISGDGLSPNKPRKEYKDLELQAGDKVMFKRGTFIREKMKVVAGVHYGAYGEGEKPTFCGSIDVSSPDLWVEIEPNIWKCLCESAVEVGNFVFGEGDERVCGTFRWERKDLCAQGDFWDGKCMGDEPHLSEVDKNSPLLLWSVKNPGEFYTHIECVVYGDRWLSGIKDDVIFEDLRFINSGVHGTTGTSGKNKNITIRNCDYEFIGGCVWSKSLRIRFGNCIEFWNYAENILVENCYFYQTYDSCVTHQGGSQTVKPAVNFVCRNNFFDSYGMAAFEYRDVLPEKSSFKDNICVNAGVGFSVQGEILPRKSEIWPQPMGHHIFLWRMDYALDGGSLEISNNIFGDAPHGAAIYSIISGVAEAQITLNRNRYFTSNKELLNRFGGKNYTYFEQFRNETGLEAEGSFGSVDVKKLRENWEKQRQLITHRQFIDFLNKIESLKCFTRHSWTSSGRPESVAEHSWRTAVMALLCKDVFPELDINKVVKMCLVHDFGEAITGDIPAFYKTDDQELVEDRAVDKILANLPEKMEKEYNDLFDEMDSLETSEAKLFKAFDNMECLISHNEAPISTWIPHEYELNFTYGESAVQWSEWTKKLKAEINADSRRKIEKEGVVND